METHETPLECDEREGGKVHREALVKALLMDQRQGSMARCQLNEYECIITSCDAFCRIVQEGMPRLNV